MRPTNWPELLDAEVAAAAAEPFAWGAHDCYRWAARVVLRLGGPDVLAGTGAWHDEDSARASILAWGKNLEAGMRRLCAERGMQEIPPALAQRGDLVVLRTPRGPMAAICIGSTALAAAEAGGVAALPMALCLRAWAV